MRSMESGGRSPIDSKVIKTARCTIKTVGDDQLGQLLDVYRECEDFLSLGPQPKASLEMVRADLEQSKTEGGTYCGIWDSQGEIIGIVDFIAGGYDGEAEQGFLSLLMISKSHRGLGIGTEIVAAIEERLMEGYGVTTMLSAVQSNNHAAMCFWQRMGYRVVTGPEPQQDGTVTCGLRKDLACQATRPQEDTL